KGVLALSKKDILYYIKKANDKGISCAIHAIGDRANKMIIDAYHSYSRTNRLITPNRIEHAQLLYPGAIEKLKSSGAIASVQPSHLIADRDTADKYWGDRCKYAYIFRTMLKNKIPTCFGSDAPIEKLDPLEGLYSAVNRCHPNDDRGAWFPNEKITVKQAVACYTTGAAFAMGMQGRLGKLSPGYLADMTVLSEDLFRIPPKNIHLTKVLGTISSGKIVYSKIK
ncbi:MAG: amidohydrolase family protein, partial [candidate division Zixibacteria bacterium]|nr:amidohydrolase family protein [candidate division Zixibacteria bacterium]